MPAMYCQPSDIRSNLGGTDAGTGTAAMLSDTQLEAAIQQASAKVSSYVGTSYEADAADPTVTIPALVYSITVQLATFYASATYRKGKDLSAYSPIVLGYNDAVATLKDIADGRIEVSPSGPSDPISERGKVINTLPAIFSWTDSGTEPDGRGGIEPAGAPGTRFADGWR